MLCKLFFSRLRVLFFLFSFTTLIYSQDSSKYFFHPVNDSLNTLDSDSLIFSDRQSPKYERLINTREWNKSNLVENIFNDRFDNNSIANTSINRKISFIDSPTFKVVLGTAILFGVSAAYFKLEADKYDLKYKDTKDNKFLLKRNDYDIYSGISLGLLQINFGYLIYRFLSD